MRTRELALSELIPNSAAEKTLHVAGSHIEKEEDGPIYVRFKKRPCFDITEPFWLSWFLQRLCCMKCCCLRPRVMENVSGGVCCCMPRRNNRLCGSVERSICTRSYSSPTSIDMALKKKITDQIKNCLSEATTKSPWAGEMNPANYRSENFLWCRRWQPLTKSTTRSDNRKFRILIAPEGLVELAIKHDPWFVFKRILCNRLLRPKVVSSACDGPHPQRKENARQEGARMRAQYLTRKESAGKEHEREVRWLNTYFVDEITVVSPRGFPNREETSKRPWDNPNWIKHVEKLQNGFDRRGQTWRAKATELGNS